MIYRILRPLYYTIKNISYVSIGTLTRNFFFCIENTPTVYNTLQPTTVIIDQTTILLVPTYLNYKNSSSSIMEKKEMQLLETGLGNVTWWGYSSSFDVLEGIEKSGKYLVLSLVTICIMILEIEKRAKIWHKLDCNHLSF